MEPEQQRELRILIDVLTELYTHGFTADWVSLDHPGPDLRILSTVRTAPDDGKKYALRVDVPIDFDASRIAHILRASLQSGNYRTDNWPKIYINPSE